MNELMLNGGTFRERIKELALLSGMGETNAQEIITGKSPLWSNMLKFGIACYLTGKEKENE